MDYCGVKYIPVCKPCDKLGIGAYLLILILDLLLDIIWWNLELFLYEHNLPFIVSSKLL